jgi:hypothetical protein
VSPRRLHRRAALAAACVLSLGWLTTMPAAAAAPTPAHGQTWNANQLVEYRWKDGHVPPGWARTAISAAGRDSNQSRAAQAAVFAQDDSASSSIAYTANLPTNWAIGYTVASAPNSFTIRIRPQGTVLDWGTLRWCQFYSSPPRGCYDLEMVALHEFGHVQTLDHADEANMDKFVDTVMHATVHSKPKVGWNMHEFGRCDVARLQIRYQPLTTATPYSTCLDLPSALTLSSSSGGLESYGTAVTLTARLSVADDVQYAHLAGQRASGRLVRLQRRAPGGSWEDAGALAPLDDETGRYAQTITVNGTYYWRAVFADPTGEGLEGSTSAALLISMDVPCIQSPGVATADPLRPVC